MAGEKLIRKWSKYYMYIFFTALFFVLKTLVINIGDFGINTQYNMFKINVVVNNHILIFKIKNNETFNRIFWIYNFWYII